jgi:FkbM family methyltransferase
MTSANESGANATILLVKRFLRKPWGKKIETVSVKWYMFRHSISRPRFPVRLRFGAWWVPRKEVVGEGVLAGTFETAELTFVGRFLKPGMTVLDIGAHHGLYTLLASKQVGSKGRVFAFEPSPRERSALRLHVRLNKGLSFSGNVTVQRFAVGNEDVEVDLFVADDWAAGYNSLRPPNVSAPTSTTRVHMVRLDDWLARHKIDHVDFIKLDIEGAELAALRGAQKLLEVRPRPVLLVEVYDIRTQPWGYPAREIVQLLDRAGYRWFSLREDGAPYPVEADRECYDANLVAVPSEGIKGFVDCFMEQSRKNA